MIEIKITEPADVCVQELIRIRSDIERGHYDNIDLIVEANVTWPDQEPDFIDNITKPTVLGIDYMIRDIILILMKKAGKEC